MGGYPICRSPLGAEDDAVEQEGVNTYLKIQPNKLRDPFTCRRSNCSIINLSLPVSQLLFLFLGPRDGSLKEDSAMIYRSFVLTIIPSEKFVLCVERFCLLTVVW